MSLMGDIGVNVALRDAFVQILAHPRDISADIHPLDTGDAEQLIMSPRDGRHPMRGLR
jgi:hypothetical protein